MSYRFKLSLKRILPYAWWVQWKGKYTMIQLMILPLMRSNFSFSTNIRHVMIKVTGYFSSKLNRTTWYISTFRNVYVHANRIFGYSAFFFRPANVSWSRNPLVLSTRSHVYELFCFVNNFQGTDRQIRRVHFCPSLFSMVYVHHLIYHR